MVTIVVASWTISLRWQRATSLPLQCDEIPLLMRFTSLNGVAATEAEAREFRPSLFSLRTGSLRSLRVPNYTFAVHTTAGFWSNLAINLFGYSSGAVRSVQVFWSLVAIVAVAWAAWLAVRSLPAACVAAWIVALSPFSLAWGTQARGYAEAIALTPLLLIALEYFRRRPDRWLRAALVFLCAFQLSLTVYTMWVYWVLPIILMAVVVLPRLSADDSARRTLRTALVLIALGLVSAMTLFTVDRLQQLVTVAAIATDTGPSWGGANLARWDELVLYARRLSDQLFVWPVAVPVLALIGLAVLRRSPARWWSWLLLAGVAAPIAFALLSGSPGYVRNLAYLLGPAAILAGLAVDRGLALITRRVRPLVVYGTGALLLATATVGASAGVERRADAMLLPDWGGAVLAMNAEPRSVGPRWFCLCLANHWQINWYRDRGDDDALLSVPVGGRIEVVMGARHETDGPAIVYRSDPNHGGVREQPLPAFLSAVRPHEIRGGVELRRWVGTRRAMDVLESVADEEPVFISARGPASPSPAQWMRFLNEGEAHERGVITFKPTIISGVRVRTMIMPAGAAVTIVRSLQDHLLIDAADIQLFTLAALE